MDILVLSDSHGNKAFVTAALERESQCKTVFFLGDGEGDIESVISDYPDRKFICVSGNCDRYSQLDTEAYKHLEGVTLMACHGHRFSVKVTLRDLYNFAAGVRASVALYGHTHNPMATYDSATGVCAVNPGALCDGKYCVISVEKGKYDITHKTL